MRIIATLLIFVFLAFLHISTLKFIPGTFSDEAQVGVQAYQMLHGNWSGFVNPFYNRHFEYVIGALPVYITAPFVAVFGLNDFSIRLAPAVFSLLSLIVLYAAMHKLKLGWFPKVYAVLLFSFSPIFFHISHTNFGHSFSLFFLLIGYYLYLFSKEKRRSLWSALSGLAFGISIYGYLGYSFATLILLSGIVITEVYKSRLSIKKYAGLAVLLLSFAVACTPQAYMALTNQRFTKRLIQKNADDKGFFTSQKLINMIKLYPRYYSKKVLFQTAEVDLPGGFVSRHSVRGHGIFLPVSLVLIILAIASIFLRDKDKHRFFPFYWLFFLFPLPDLITASQDKPPYPFALYTTAYFLPFISAFVIDKWEKIFEKNKLFLSAIAIVLLTITLSQASDFLLDYQTYSHYSADYWGWQYGPKEIIKYFVGHQREYDELFIHSTFNGPEALIPFYDPEGICTKCKLGGLEKYSADKKQLFAFRVGEDIKSLAAFPELKLVFVPQVHIYLPNGFSEYTIGQFKSVENSPSQIF